MKWIKQTDPEYLPGWVCEQCGSLVVTADPDAPPPCECRACGAGGDNPSGLATLGHLPLHKGGTPPMAAKERLKMPASAEEPDVFTDITGQESIIEGVRRAQVEAERRCIQANAVLINDEMFLSKLPFPPYGEVKMICGLKAFYCPTLPPEVAFAVCETPMPKEQSAEVEEIVRCGECEHFDPRDLDGDGTFWCEYTGYGRITQHDYCSAGIRKKNGGAGGELPQSTPDGIDSSLPEGADYPSVSLSADTSPDKGRQGREDDAFMTAFQASL